MKRICLLLTLFCLPLCAWAENLPVNHPVIVAGEVLRGSFTEEKQLNGFKAPLRSKGHFVVAPGHGLIWSVETPFAITTVITPSGVIQKVDGNQTMNLPTKRIPFVLHLYEMLGGTLAGDWTALAQEFTIKRSGDAIHWQVQLTPRKKDNPVMPFLAITSMGSHFVEKIKLSKVDGDVDQLTFFDQKLSTSPLTAREAAMLASAP